MLWFEAIAIGMEFFSAAAEHLMFNQAHHDEATFQPSITVGSQSVPELGYATWLHFNLDTAKARSRSFVSMCWAMPRTRSPACRVTTRRAFLAAP